MHSSPKPIGNLDDMDWARLALDIKSWGRELGFQKVGISDIELGEAEIRLRNWLAAGRHGSMTYMERHGTKRSRPQQLIPGTVRIISARMDYLPPQSAPAEDVLQQSAHAYVSRYALGRDYHKILRQRLRRLAERIHEVEMASDRVLRDFDTPDAFEEVL